MIQDIGPHKFDLTYGQPEPQDGDFVLYMKNNQTLLRKNADDTYEIPCFGDFPGEKEELKKQAYYMFAIDDMKYFYVKEMKHGEENGYEFC